MQKHSFYIDKLTKSIEHSDTGKNYETNILPVSAIDLKQIKKKDGW